MAKKILVKDDNGGMESSEVDINNVPIGESYTLPEKNKVTNIPTNTNLELLKNNENALLYALSF